MPSHIGMAGSLITGAKHTGPLKHGKDWEKAADPVQRLKRHEHRRKTPERWSELRSSTLSSLSASGTQSSSLRRGKLAASSSMPSLRGPSRLAREPPVVTRYTKTMHDLQSLFKEHDLAGLGEITMDALRDSFEKLGYAMDRDTFMVYSEKFFPKGTDSVNIDDFIRFHDWVMSNQPPSVHHFGGLIWVQKPTKVEAPPCLDKVRLEAEHHVRDVLNHHSTGSGYLNQQQMADVIHDLGLDNGKHSDDPHHLEQSILHLFEMADKNHDGRVSFHEFIDFHNHYIEMQSSLKSTSSRGSFFKKSMDGVLDRPVSKEKHEERTGLHHARDAAEYIGKRPTMTHRS